MSDFRQRFAAQRWSGPLVTSVLALAIAAAVLVAGVPTLIGAITSPSWDGQDEDIFASLEVAHHRQAKVSTQRFLGRSPFVVPSRPKTRPAAPKPRPERPKPDPRPEPKPDPGPPATYTGPKPTGVVGPVVFFGSNDQIRLGREKNGVRVLGILGPTEVSLGHKGGEYDVKFLDDDFSSIFKPFSDPVREDVLGEAPDTVSEPVASEPTPPPPSAPRETAPQAAETPNSGSWSPQRGGTIKVTFNDRGVEKTIIGRIQYLGGGANGQGRSMVVRGEVDGRTIFQRIDEAQVIEMSEAPEDSVPPLDDQSRGDGGDDNGNEADEESMDDLDPSSNPESTLRNMTTAQLESRHYQVTQILNRPELGDDMRAGLENELRMINDILRAPANDG